MLKDDLETDLSIDFPSDFENESNQQKNLNNKERDISKTPQNLAQQIENLDNNSIFSKLNNSISTFDHEIASDEEFTDEIISNYNNDDLPSEIISSERTLSDNNSKKNQDLDTKIPPKTFQNDFLPKDDNDIDENIVLNIEEQIKLAADKIIQDVSNPPNSPPPDQKTTNKLHVKFVPETEELAKAAFELTKIRKRQEKELEEYERTLQHFYDLYGQGEEEEEEFNDDLLPQYEYGVLMFQNGQHNDENEFKSGNAVYNHEDQLYQLKDLIADDAKLLEDFDNANTASKKSPSKDKKEQISLHNSPNASIENEKQEEVIPPQSTIPLKEIIKEDSMGTGIPNDVPDKPIYLDQTPEKEKEKEAEVQPLIPPIDLSQFNSSKAIANKKQNKFLDTVNRLNKKANNANQAADIRAPVTNQPKSKPTNVKKKLPQPKNAKPVVLEKYENVNIENSSSDNHPRSILQQAQQKSMENSPEELRNNGFLITFLPSAAAASQNNKILTSLPPTQNTVDKLSIHKPQLAELTELKDDNISNEEEIPQFTDKELEAALKEIMESKKMPQKEMVEPLLGYIKKNVFKCIIDQDYDEAERLKEAEKFITSKSITSNTKEGQKQVTKSIQEKIENAKNKIFEIKQEYKMRIDSFEEQVKVKNDELKQKHSEELDNFENTWDNQNVLMQYTKPSSQLLEIRRLQKNKALANDFQGARELKKRGDQLEKEETKRAQDKAVSAMQMSYQHLLRKQKREEEYAKQNWERQRILIENERDQEISAVELKIKQLKTQLAEIKTRERDKDKSKPIVTRKFQPSSRSSSLSGTFNSISRPSFVSDQNKRKAKDTSPMATSPRTRKQMAEFKTAPRQERLNLNGFNVHKFVNVKSVNKNSTKPSISHVKLEKTEF